MNWSTRYGAFPRKMNPDLPYGKCAPEIRQRQFFTDSDCPKRISDYSPIPTQFDMTHSSTNDIAALPPGFKLTTLDNGLVIIVRRSRFRELLLPEIAVLKLLYDN